MAKVLLDTNFILTCLKEKIDFFEDLTFMGLRIIIPKQVIKELRGMEENKSKLAIKLLKKNSFEEIDIGKGHVDKKIINFLNKNPGILLATLDRELKSKVKNKKVVIRNKKRLEII